MKIMKTGPQKKPSAIRKTGTQAMGGMGLKSSMTGLSNESNILENPISRPIGTANMNARANPVANLCSEADMFCHILMPRNGSSCVNELMNAI